jgi:hypothetical protein
MIDIRDESGFNHNEGQIILSNLNNRQPLEIYEDFKFIKHLLKVIEASVIAKKDTFSHIEMIEKTLENLTENKSSDNE